MTLISGEIPSQGFEIVRDRIGEILAEELCGQYNLTQDDDFKVSVFIERSVAFNYSEYPAINVTIEQGDLDGHYQGFTDGNYVFNIDVHTSGDSNKDKLGGAVSVVRNHKLMGRCRAIIENPVYKTLGFEPPFLMRRAITRMIFLAPEKNDSGHVATSRLSLQVKVSENTELLDALNIGSYRTSVKLSLTDLGYVFTEIEA